MANLINFRTAHLTQTTFPLVAKKDIIEVPVVVRSTGDVTRARRSQMTKNEKGARPVVVQDVT